MELREITNNQEWEDFLAQCSEKTFLHSWSWGEFNDKMGRKSWRFGVWSNGKLVACALVSKIGAKRGTFLFIPHGPAVIEALDAKDKKEVLQVILAHLKTLAKEEKAVFIRISPIWRQAEQNINCFADSGFRPAPIHMHPEVTWELDISLPEDELLANMRKTTRYLIRQAEKNPDIQIVKSRDVKDLEEFYRVYAQTGKRQHFNAYSKNYIEKEFSALAEKNEVLLFTGKYKGEIAVVAMFVFWQGGCFYHHSGSLPKFNKFPVSYLLQWEAIKEAKNRGCLAYNFWGIAPDIKEESDVKKSKHPWAGLSLFKMGFGGSIKEYVKTQDYIISQKYWLNYIIEKLRKIKRNL